VHQLGEGGLRVVEGVAAKQFGVSSHRCSAYTCRDPRNRTKIPSTR
jgi:hypothetical protein